MLVQCKHWKVYKVGVSPGARAVWHPDAEKADHAILVTTGKFTQDAKAFAAGKPMELIDGEQLSRRGRGGQIQRRRRFAGRGQLVWQLRQCRDDHITRLSVLPFNDGAAPGKAKREPILGLFDVSELPGKKERASGIDAGVRCRSYELLCHLLGVDVPDVAVRAQDEFAAVLVALPLGDHLHVDAEFDGCTTDAAGANILLTKTYRSKLL